MELTKKGLLEILKPFADDCPVKYVSKAGGLPVTKVAYVYTKDGGYILLEEADSLFIHENWSITLWLTDGTTEVVPGNTVPDGTVKGE